MNSLDRPGTENHIPVPSRERLEEIAAFFKDTVPVEIISRAGYEHRPPVVDESVDEINARIEKSIRSGVCDLFSMAKKLQFREDTLKEYLRRLEREGRVAQIREDVYQLNGQD